MVPDSINARCVEFLDAHAAMDHSAVEAAGAESQGGVVRIQRVMEPAELFAEEWFVDAVLLCPEVVGAVRSLLGKEFGLPVLISNHRVTPETSPAEEQVWCAPCPPCCQQPAASSLAHS